MPKKVVDTFIIINDKGLHIRPSTELVKCATGFKSRLMLFYDGVSVNAKSLLGILTLTAMRGAQITIEAIGEDAEEAVRSILDLASHEFWIVY